MQAHDLDAPNLDAVREPRGRSRLFLEDGPSMSHEDDDASASLEDDASMSITPSANKRIFRASAHFLVCVCGSGRCRRRARLAVHR
jgi:hypothetical protein